MPRTMNTVAILLPVLLLVACSNMKPVKGNLNADTIRQQIKPGDSIVVFTKKSKDNIVVDSIDDTTISGSGKHFPIADILRIEKKTPAPGKTTVLVAGGVFTAWAFYQIIIILGLVSAALTP